MYEYQEPTPHLYGRPTGHGLGHDDDDMETYVARTPSGSVYIPSGQSGQRRAGQSSGQVRSEYWREHQLCPSSYVSSDQSDQSGQVRSGQWCTHSPAPSCHHQVSASAIRSGQCPKASGTIRLCDIGHLCINLHAVCVFSQLAVMRFQCVARF